MRILIDGDASPVKNDIIEIAGLFKLEVVLVTSINHYTNKIYPDYVTVSYVDKGQDEADFQLITLLKQADILVTQDYGLASLALSKARVIHHKGWEYTDYNIDSLLASRYRSSQLRKAGLRTKGPSRFTEEDRQQFRAKLEEIIQNQSEIMK